METQAETWQRLKGDDMILRIVLCLSFIFAIAVASEATCRRSYVCDDYGNNCQYTDICDSTFDLPAVGLDPLPSLPAIGLKPLPPIGVPPIGTSECKYMQVDGRWQEVCY